MGGSGYPPSRSKYPLLGAILLTQFRGTRRVLVREGAYLAKTHNRGLGELVSVGFRV